MAAARRRPHGPTVDAEEVARFAALSESWWDEDGPFGPLHRFVPVRIAYIRDQIVRRLGVDGSRPKPLAGLRVLDVGCGGGLLAEPMARLGATVVGIDAGEETVRAAGRHAAGAGLEIDYRVASLEGLAASGERFDAVVASEVVEHVADLPSFVAAAADALVSGGLFVATTINRTAKSFALAIVGAEYLLRWVPVGTHDWRRFVRPSELAAACRAAGLEMVDLSGLSYRPLADEFVRSGDVSVNYAAAAVKAA